MSGKKEVDQQRFTGTYNTLAMSVDAGNAQPTGAYPTGSLAPGQHNKQDTTFVSPQTGKIHTFLPGDRVDQSYQLLSLLGRGGMGMVFACKHLALDKQYALKLLPAGNVDNDAWNRFQAEAKALARLNHKGIVRIHNMGVHEGEFPYLVMDLLSRETLDQLIHQSGPLPADQAVELFILMADAFDSAHKNGIIHRDIKPANVMIVRDANERIEATKIVDFGIARLSEKDLDSQSQTATGLVFGTPYYMSPEQCQGHRADARSDIYSLGCALFETVTGRVPFKGENAFLTFFKHQTEAPPKLKDLASGVAFPEGLQEALDKMLHKNVEKRYQTMAQVKQDLSRISTGKTISAAGPVSSTTAQPARAVIKLDSSTEAKKNLDSPKSTLSELLPAPVRLPLVVMLAGLVILSVALPCFFIFASISGKKPVKTAQTGIISRDLANEKIATAKEKAAGADEGSLDPAQARNGKMNNKSGAAMYSMLLDQDLSEGGLDESEEKSAKRFDYDSLSVESDRLGKSLNKFLRDNVGGHFFKPKAKPPGFQFPEDISIGAVRVGFNSPVLATGFVPAPHLGSVTLYLETATNKNSQLLDLFWPDDITGLEIVWPHPENALKRITKWTRLRELSLFNPLIKAPPSLQSFDESPFTDADLPKLNQFTHLRSLGLAGDDITGPAVLKIPFLKNLNTLKLKRIVNFAPVLAALPTMDNIEQLWLGNLILQDEQLENITRMKNLNSLTIMVSKLTPDSVRYFQRMKNLRFLHLDTHWTTDQVNAFKAALPDCSCQFEPRVDHKFWDLVPKDKDSSVRRSEDPWLKKVQTQ